jgi:hypothetical protein
MGASVIEHCSRFQKMGQCPDLVFRSFYKADEDVNRCVLFAGEQR